MVTDIFSIASDHYRVPKSDGLDRTVTGLHVKATKVKFSPDSARLIQFKNLREWRKNIELIRGFPSQVSNSTNKRWSDRQISKM